MEMERKFDLEERTLSFARNVKDFVHKHSSRTTSNDINCRQLIRSSASVGANYIEANEALGKRDFLNRIKICRKEAKESGYWLKLIDVTDSEGDVIRESLLNESVQLVKIFHSILHRAGVTKQSI